MRNSSLVIAMAIAAGVVVGALIVATPTSPPASAAARDPVAARDPLAQEVRALSAQVGILRDHLGRTPPAGTAAAAAAAPPDLEARVEPVETAAQAEARARAGAVVDAAIASGRFTTADHRELVLALASASRENAAEVLSRLAVAVNSDRVIPETPGWSRP